MREEEEREGAIDLNKPILPDFISGEEEILFWLREFGKLGFSELQISRLLAPRLAKNNYIRVMAALFTSDTAVNRAYELGKEEASFELLSSLQIRANSAVADSATTELLLKLNRSMAVAAEINKRFR